MLAELWGQAKTPLNGLLLALALVSYLLADVRSALVILVMVVLSIGLSFVQEHRSNDAAAKLATMVRTHASVKRRRGEDARAADAAQEAFTEIPLDELVPGDGGGGVVGRRHDPRRPAPADGQGPLRQPVGADRGIHAGGEGGPGLRGRRGGSVRADQHLLHGLQRPSAVSRPAWWRTTGDRPPISAPWPARSSAPVEPTAFDNGVGRFAWLDDPLHPGHGPAGLSDQRPDQGRLAAPTAADQPRYVYADVTWSQETHTVSCI